MRVCRNPFSPESGSLEVRSFFLNCKQITDINRAGGVLSSIPVEGQQKQFNGSCIIAHAATKEEILEQLRKDPFTSGGVWNLEEVRAFEIAVGYGC